MVVIDGRVELDKIVANGALVVEDKSDDKGVAKGNADVDVE